MLRSRARSKKAKPRPPLCEITDTSPASGSFGISGPAVASITGLKVGENAHGDVDEAFGVRPAHRHVVALGDLAHFLLHALAGAARLLGKARTQDQRGLDAGAGAALQLVRHELRRNDQRDEIRQRREFLDA